MKVFYLEQNDMMQKAIELALVAKGIEVYTASPGDDFDHILMDWGADLLVVDYSSVDGELNKYLSTQIPVLVTCDNEEVHGDFEVVSKPLNPVEFAHLILKKFNA